MKNPWKNLKADKSDKYISNIDRKNMPELEKKFVKEYKLHLELLPEPFVGNPKASIYLLNLNPGFSEENGEEHKKNKKLRECIFKNNNQNYKHQKYPFYWLDPDLKKTSGGNWWRKKIKQPLKEIGNDELVSKKIFCLEYFPYHSEKFKELKSIPIESKEYTFSLIEKAIKAEKIIIIMRAKKKWYESVKDAKGVKCLEEYRRKKYKDANGEEYSRVMELKNPMNPSISLENMNPGDFCRVLKILKGKTQ